MCRLIVTQKASQLRDRAACHTQEYVPVSMVTGMLKPQPLCRRVALGPNVCDLTPSDVMDAARFSHLENIADITHTHKKRMTSTAMRIANSGKCFDELLINIAYEANGADA